METLRISPVIVPVSKIDDICDLFEIEPQNTLDSYNFPTKTVKEMQELFTEYLKSCNDDSYVNYTLIESKAIFLNNLIQTGNLGLISQFCDLFDPITLYQIVNAKPRNMYFGNVLHTTLYSNVGESARQLYTYFRFVGAIPCMDYYNKMPWEQKGAIWTCIPDTVYKRDVNEFTDIYQWATDFEIEKEYEFGQIMNSCPNPDPNPNPTQIKSKTMRSFSTPCSCGYHHYSDYDSDYGSD
jgi:hypothetical protein